MATKQRKEPLTTIAVNKSVIELLDKYLDGKNLSRKEFVEKAIIYFERTGFDLNASVSETSELQNAVAELKEETQKSRSFNTSVLNLMQNIYNAQLANQKLIPAQIKAQKDADYKARYLQVKNRLTEMCNNKHAIRVGRIKNLLSEFFDI